MKTMLILALLALADTSGFAQLDTTFGQVYEEQWQWQLQMNPCKEFLRQQCSPVAVPFIGSQMWQASSCQVMRQQYCQRLAQIPVHSRCQAICSVAQAIMQQQWQGFYQPQVEIMRMALQSLPAMCNVYVPAYCTTYPCSVATTATCVGGACY